MAITEESQSAAAAPRRPTNIELAVQFEGDLDLTAKVESFLDQQYERADLMYVEVFVFPSSCLAASFVEAAMESDAAFVAGNGGPVYTVEPKIDAGLQIDRFLTETPSCEVEFRWVRLEEQVTLMVVTG